ncbi:hypothetical protein [Paenibacillus agricola]|uniref:Uncharacterized protein n=1 Tax=Paenibacillus agricola TaxID=2716264 RepID=A0ABX0JFW5_9BACL|nr:hypothetical protein [Paenibacillus agricola]NHN35042.1 hypothetical protein [Paenibacillus agricola]
MDQMRRSQAIWVGLISILLSIGYFTNFIGFSFLGHEMGSQDSYVRVWAQTSLLLGICLLALLGLFVLFKREHFLKKTVEFFILICIFLLLIIQLPPVYWWVFMGISGADANFLIALPHFIVLCISVKIYAVTIDRRFFSSYYK